MATTRRFRGILEPLPGGLGWTVIRLPFDPTDAWPKRHGLRVKGTINSIAFRTSLFGFSDGSGHFLLVNQKMQKAASVALGGLAGVVLEPDLEERTPIVPVELAKLLKQDGELRKYFERLSPSARKFFADRVSEPKSVETRVRRAEQSAEQMLLALDGEHELPPILQVVFRRVAGAEAGWKAMSMTQRRGHLLAIFYYQSPEAREKRAVKVAEEAREVAQKKGLMARTSEMRDFE